MISSGPQSEDSLSLPEVHASVSTSQLSLFKRMFAFAGPAYLVSVGYMDPGNWATDLEGGARFGYQLLWVLVMSNIMAILLQTLSARLGIVSGRDLAQACREHYPKRISFILWVLCEIAIAACDLAEVLGAAIALNLLFGIPLLAGVLITTLDTLLVLWLTNFGIRLVEALVLVLIATIGGCFLLEIIFAKPHMVRVIGGLVPKLTDESLYIAIGILGATVMPHNLYLHSALVQTRRIGVGEAEKTEACKFNLIDSVVALNAALFVNAAILVLAAAVFYNRGVVVTQIQQAHELLAPLLGTTAASVLFAVALLCSGQSSTLTGTMAGQIVMEGFLNFRMRPWLRRLMTRMIAVVPAALTIYATGDQGSYKLLILSQVILSMQLPFAVIPLIHFTSEKARMGPFANRPWVRSVAWLMAFVIVGLNIRLVYGVLRDWLTANPALQGWILLGTIPICAGLLALLIWVTLQPMLPAWLGRRGAGPVSLPKAVAKNLAMPKYERILVPLDHSNRDHVAISHAAALARMHSSTLYLLHVEEGVTSKMYGALSSTAEVEAGRRYLDEIIDSLRAESIHVEAVVRHSDKPRDEIVAYAKLIRPDLLVMGAHGHTGWRDLVFGTTINAVRHKLDIPILVVRDSG
ncbi:MAG TPA: Nramp family divalent metal transporter [Bryobacteraceae bacterium]|nr:Nramp family divalent metal transporter [Bryobacteraceae bacterium]